MSHVVASVPLEPAATPDVGVGDEDGDDEQHHLDEREERPARLKATANG